MNRRDIYLKILTGLFLIPVLCFIISGEAKATPIDVYPDFAIQPQCVQEYLRRQPISVIDSDYLPIENPENYSAVTKMYGAEGSDTYSYVEIYLRPSRQDSLTHEIGHMVSNYQNHPDWWCKQPFFETIWLAERGWLTPGYVYDNKNEWFAFCYECYVKYPIALKFMCPMTYNYIEVVLSYMALDNMMSANSAAY